MNYRLVTNTHKGEIVLKYLIILHMVNMKVVYCIKLMTMKRKGNTKQLEVSEYL